MYQLAGEIGSPIFGTFARIFPAKWSVVGGVTGKHDQTQKGSGYSARCRAFECQLTAGDLYNGEPESLSISF